MINARAETVATKPAYRSAYKARRCIIPAIGFYEWKRNVTPKIPHYIHKRDDSPMGFAGLWETWKGQDQTIESCTIITTTFNDVMAQLHDRMPVILDPEHFNWWITGAIDEVGQLVVPCPPEELDIYSVSASEQRAKRRAGAIASGRVTTVATGLEASQHQRLRQVSVKVHDKGKQG